MLESADLRISGALQTALPPAIAVAVSLGVFVLLRAKLAPARSAAGESDQSTAPRPATGMLAPAIAALALTLSAIAADLVIRPRSSMSDVFWPTDAVLRTVHVVLLAAVLLGLAGLTRTLPAGVGVPMRLVLRAGVGVGALGLTGGFLLENGIWTPATFWTIAGATGIAFALGASAASHTLRTSDTPLVHPPTLALIVGGSAAPIFFSTNTVGAHTLASLAVGVGLLALASLKYKALAQSPGAFGIALAALLAQASVAATVADDMLIATAGALALLPFALLVHRTHALRVLPGPAWLLPALVQAGVIALILFVAALFASGGLVIDESSMPWHYGSEAGDAGDSYDYYDY